MPQANVEMGDTFSSKPNGGYGYYGINIGNCGDRDLASDQPGYTCEIDFLAGCYSPVFARPARYYPAAANKAKVWVNKTDGGPADHVMCVNDGQIIDYDIKGQ